MKIVQQILSKLSVFDLKRLITAKKLHAARESVHERIVQLSTKLEGAQSVLAKLDRRILRLVRRTTASRGAGARRGRGRGRRGARPGSLRSYLMGALKKLGGSGTARDLANLALKAGYKTRSKIEVFLRAVHQALNVNKEFARGPNGKYTLRK